MTTYILLLLAFCSSALYQAPRMQLTPAQLVQEEAALRAAITRSGNNGRNMRLLATAVRLSFHDCVGGCNGCINLNNPDNAGLRDPVQTLTNMYYQRNADRFMSRADYWALAGMVAVKMGASLRQGCPGGSCISLTFRTGRVDCAPTFNTNVNHAFPSSHAGTNATLEFFRTEFGFDARQTVAILGAHTLGRASRQNSGFNGPWVGNEDSLDNAYYRDLTNRVWRQSNIAPTGAEPHFQWNRVDNRRRMMLNADLSLLKNIRVNEETGESACRDSSTSCGDSTTASITREYSANNNRWLRDFAATFEVMVENGNTDLQLVQDTTTTSTTTTPATTETTTTTTATTSQSSSTSSEGSTTPPSTSTPRPSRSPSSPRPSNAPTSTSTQPSVNPASGLPTSPSGPPSIPPRPSGGRRGDRRGGRNGRQRDNDTAAAGEEDRRRGRRGGSRNRRSRGGRGKRALSVLAKYLGALH